MLGMVRTKPARNNWSDKFLSNGFYLGKWLLIRTSLWIWFVERKERISRVANSASGIHCSRLHLPLDTVRYLGDREEFLVSTQMGKNPTVQQSTNSLVTCFLQSDHSRCNQCSKVFFENLRRSTINQMDKLPSFIVDTYSSFTKQLCPCCGMFSNEITGYRGGEIT